MNKKILAIIVIIIAILIASFFFYTHNTMKVGNSYFVIPTGYHVIDEGDYINLTSDINYMCLVKEAADENVNNSIDKYTNIKQVKENDTLKYSNYSSGDIEVIKSISNKNAKPSTFQS